MVLKQWTNAVIGVIDKKLERFDPKWQAANGKGGLRSRYEDKTGIARHREWRGVKDTFVDYTAWLNNLLAMGKMVASAPVPILKGFWEYRWMGSYLGTFAFIDRLFEGLPGGRAEDRPHEYALYRQQPHEKRSPWSWPTTSVWAAEGTATTSFPWTRSCRPCL